MPKTRFAVKRGGRYRFRVINAAPLDCPVQLQVEGHRLMIIASDGAPVKSTDASHLLLFPGMDLIIIINKYINSTRNQFDNKVRTQEYHKDVRNFPIKNIIYGI